MSKPVSALMGAAYDGIVRVEDCGLQGMITLRGDLSSEPVAAAATGATGQDMPGQRRANVAGENGLCWMSPDELLVLVPHAEVGDKLAAMTKALGNAHSLAADVSDARAMFRVSGANAREVMAKLAPVDFAPGAFGPGDFRRSRLAQVAGAFWMEEDGSFCIICFRSVADYVFKLLKVAAQPGSAVGVF
ncbi:sarcosine oxidase subunit gamma [Ruegeria sp. WL0004]|uniref:Sarcosine oxidase subunit gamma n=1 Tax=Ruegeria marisflavi TaxID=2984152 RepID=A0ABT2WQ17_9RHOB|nr:sarcosine oxidase subunit gamma family protein [Ruegeria sp. WL0004]MCU9838011.1 sarcosine oxidase subunit gamma [Ruegeria sp. WL0004]